MPATIAIRVETQKLAKDCFAAGFDYAQGYYYMRPEIISGHKLSSSQLAIFQLLNLLAGEGPLEDIEEAFRRDPTLSYQLLRYLNSAGLSRGHEIDSIRRALVLLGRQPLQRWLTLLLFASQGPRKAPLMIDASTRARLAELLREHAPGLDHSPAALHRSFLVGMLSLLDALLGQPMPELLEGLHLSAEVRNALLSKEGEDGCILRLVEALEQESPKQIREANQRVGVPSHLLGQLTLDAMAWMAAHS